MKLLALRCAGYNNVDLKAAAENGITVVRVPAYSPYAVAEYTVALMLSLNRKIPRAPGAHATATSPCTAFWDSTCMAKRQVSSAQVNSQEVIAILRGFGMNILAYDLYPDYNFAREHQVYTPRWTNCTAARTSSPCTARSRSRPDT